MLPRELPAAKPVEWVGSSRRDLRECPDDVKDTIGYALHLAQHGTTHSDARAMHGVLREVVEIPVDDERGTYRGMYTVRFAGAVYVLHAFKKKSTRGIKTPKRDLDLIANRLTAARKHHRQHYRRP